MKLSELNLGVPAKVMDVEGNDDLSLRIFEMGITPGSTLSVRGRAPLGDPIEVEIRQYRLSLRLSEAERVVVEAVE